MISDIACLLFSWFSPMFMKETVGYQSTILTTTPERAVFKVAV
jgi:hypothetical protein